MKTGKRCLWELAGLRGGSSLREKHSGGLTQSVQIPRLLIGRMFGRRGQLECVGDASTFCWRAQVSGGAHMYYVRVSVCVCPLPPHTPRFVLLSSEGRRPGLTPRHGELRKRPHGRLDTCGYSLTICPHTLRETRDYRVILEVAALTQNH